MQRPVRAIAYGFLTWWLWFAFIGVSQLLPSSLRSAPSFPSLRLLVLVLLVVILAVDYLRRIGRSSLAEGIAVGVTWALLLVANDLGHYLFMDPTDIGTYLAVFAPLYAWIPVATTVVFSNLAAAPRPAG
jgi:hypothetical protein